MQLKTRSFAAINPIVLFSSLFILCHGAIAGTTPLSQQDHAHQNATHSSLYTSKRLKEMMPKFLYNYIDFRFLSSTETNFNRFKGHSNVYSAGTDHIKINKKLYAGLYVFQINTAVESEVRLAPGGIVYGSQSISNNTLFGHLLKLFNHHFFIDFSAAYGLNSISGSMLFTPKVTQATSRSTNSNWFAGLTGIYAKSWKKFSGKVSLGGIYSQIISDTSYSFFEEPIGVKATLPLTTNVLFTFENAEIGYKLNKTFIPFVNAGLIQVPYFSKSRPILTTAIVGGLPQLELNKNAYKVGAGLVFKQKHYDVRLEQRYYNSANTYMSYLTSLGINFRFS